MPGENCQEQQGSALSGMAFAPTAGSFPDTYDGALFFSDHSRECIWVLRADANGLPDPATKQAFAQDADFPVDLEFGPNGELFYPDIVSGNVRRISFTGRPRQRPTDRGRDCDAAVRQRAARRWTSTAAGSSDPDPGDTLTYAWDLDDDGQLDDSTSVSPSFTYTNPGVYTVTLRVTDTSGAFDEDTVTINAGGGGPRPPRSTHRRRARPGASASRSRSPAPPPTPRTARCRHGARLAARSCTTAPLPGNCHEHAIQSFENTAGGTFVAPDHEYPSHLELKLTATDSDSNTATVSRQLDPRTVSITAATDPPGLTVSLGTASGTAPVTVTVIEGSANTLSAPSPQAQSDTTYEFSSWSDGQAQTHNVAPTSSTTYTATFAPRTPGTSTLTFKPRPDAHVDEANANTNFGSATTLRTDAGGNPDIESYLRFLVDGLTGKVQSAKLRLFSTNNTVDGPAVYPTSSTAGESRRSPGTTSPRRPGGALADSGAIATGVWTEWDVTPAVTAEGQVSFRLASAVTDGVNFHSRESTTATLRPAARADRAERRLRPAEGRERRLRVSLVPAYNACTSPNRTHGPPLAQPVVQPARAVVAAAHVRERPR